MKIILLIFLTINIYADKNWIKIEPINKTTTTKSNTKLDANISKITILKQLIDTVNKKDEPSNDDKHWFILNDEASK